MSEPSRATARPRGVSPRQDGQVARSSPRARLLVGVNAFEPGQAHALHAHQGMDKIYYVLEGEGLFLLDGAELPMRAGDLLVAPDGVPHGVRNASAARLAGAGRARPWHHAR